MLFELFTEHWQLSTLQEFAYNTTINGAHQTEKLHVSDQNAAPGRKTLICKGTLETGLMH